MAPTLRRLLLPLVAALAVLAAGELAARRLGRPGTRLWTRVSAWDQGFSQRWSWSATEAPRPALVVAGSSLSRRPGEAHTLASELARVLGREVRNESGDGHFLADEWACLLARRMPTAERHLIELNAFTFDERTWLYAAQDEGDVVRREENALALLPCVSNRLRLSLLRRPGLHAVLSSAVRRAFRPYDLGLGLRATLRIELKTHVLARRGPAEALDEAQPPERVLALVAHNFAQKSYADGLDARVLAELLGWIAAQPDPRAYVLYFPPLELALIEHAAGAEAVARLRAWIDGVRASCARAGIPCLDATDLFADRVRLFADYGHLRERAFEPLAEHVARELARL